MTYSSLLKDIRNRLTPVAGEFSLPEAERILEFHLNCSRSELYIDKGADPPAPELLRKIEGIIARRLTGEPLAYILGSAFFYHKEFIVTPDVLIPRPDSEILVEAVVHHEPAGRRTFLDIGTGSGCIAATLAEQRPHWCALAIDLSFKALTVARKNCGSNVSLVCANLVSALKERGIDFIVSNPPYIASETIATLPSSVRDFEPLQALDGGSDGLEFYRQLAKVTPPLLETGGRIYCEIGHDQGKRAPDIFKACGWTGIEVMDDFGGNARVIMATKPEERSPKE